MVLHPCRMGKQITITNREQAMLQINVRELQVPEGFPLSPIRSADRSRCCYSKANCPPAILSPLL